MFEQERAPPVLTAPRRRPAFELFYRRQFPAQSSTSFFARQSDRSPSCLPIHGFHLHPKKYGQQDLCSLLLGCFCLHLFFFRPSPFSPAFRRLARTPPVPSVVISGELFTTLPRGSKGPRAPFFVYHSHVRSFHLRMQAVETPTAEGV